MKVVRPRTGADGSVARRWGALLLGAVLLLPSGFIVLASSAGPERWLGAGLIGLAAYLVAGAFIPRLLRFGGPTAPVYVAVPVMVAAMSFTEGKLLLGAVLLCAAAVFVAYGLATRRHPSADER